MKKLTNLMIRDCTSQGSEICHELADALYQHQAAMAKDPLHKETLGNMRYENRLKPSFDSADEKQLLVAFDGEKPVGYIFTAAEEVTEESRRQLPPWGEGAGFYPEWLRALPGARYLFVYVSEGNNAATFYARYGFKFSHDVLGGIIKAYYQEI